MSVVSIHGGPVVDQRKSIEEVVRACKAELARAESGEIEGVAIVYVYRDGSVGRSVAGDETSHMVGAIERVKASIVRRLDE